MGVVYLQVGVVYMSSRLIVNLTQVYGPLYILDSIGMNRVSHTHWYCFHGDGVIGVAVECGHIPVGHLFEWVGDIVYIEEIEQAHWKIRESLPLSLLLSRLLFLPLLLISLYTLYIFHSAVGVFLRIVLCTVCIVSCYLLPRRQLFIRLRP